MLQEAALTSNPITSSCLFRLHFFKSVATKIAYQNLHVCAPQGYHRPNRYFVEEDISFLELELVHNSAAEDQCLLTTRVAIACISIFGTPSSD